MKHSLEKLYHENKDKVSELWERLNDISKKKEFWFNKKEGLKKVLDDKIKSLKDFKSQKDQSNLEVQTLKEGRGKLNKNVKSLIERVKRLNKEKQKAYKKYKVRVDPEKIQAKINVLEDKIEIETSFEKEQKLMEEIRRLKKTYEEVSDVAKIAKDAQRLNKEIDESKAKADEFHKKIQGLMKDKHYSNFMKLSNEIVRVKKEQDNAFQRFIDFKNKYNKVNRLFKESGKPLKHTKKELNKRHMLKKVEREAKTKEILKKKSKEVEEKVKKKKKLTTEDLIAFQGVSDESYK